MVHHLANPSAFFNHLYKYLKPGGYIIIQDIYTSFVMKFLLRVMRHEGWSYDVDVFSKDAICNNKDDSLSANCAIPELLLDNKENFEKTFTGFRIIKKENNEVLLFPLRWSNL